MKYIYYIYFAIVSIVIVFLLSVIANQQREINRLDKSIQTIIEDYQRVGEVQKGEVFPDI